MAVSAVEILMPEVPAAAVKVILHRNVLPSGRANFLVAPGGTRGGHGLARSAGGVFSWSITPVSAIFNSPIAHVGSERRQHITCRPTIARLPVRFYVLGRTILGAVAVRADDYFISGAL